MMKMRRPSTIRTTKRKTISSKRTTKVLNLSVDDKGRLVLELNLVAHIPLRLFKHPATNGAGNTVVDFYLKKVARELLLHGPAEVDEFIEDYLKQK
jgi:hypothetical protein